jgi:hypothetical protein
MTAGFVGLGCGFALVCVHAGLFASACVFRLRALGAAIGKARFAGPQFKFFLTHHAGFNRKTQFDWMSQNLATINRFLISDCLRFAYSC